MKLWLSKNSEISVREQLMTQITLGITSGDLPVGEKLPSTRELALRFNVHANTIGSAYRKLGEQGLIEFKKGSGFYVCEKNEYRPEDAARLNTLIDEFFRKARSHGFSKSEIYACLQDRMTPEKSKLITIIECDEDFRQILIEEIKQVTSHRIEGTSFDSFINSFQNNDAIYVALHENQAKIEKILPADRKCLYLMTRSVSDSLTGETRPARDDLIAVVSGWEKFLFWSKTILTAADIETDSILLRSTAEKNWRKGLINASLIICDALTAKKFPADERIKIFRIIADTSIAQLDEIYFTGDEPV